MTGVGVRRVMTIGLVAAVGWSGLAGARATPWAAATSGGTSRVTGGVAAASVSTTPLDTASVLAISADGRIVAGYTANDPNLPYSVIDRAAGTEVHERAFQLMTRDGRHLVTDTEVRTVGGAGVALPPLPDFYLADGVVGASADGHLVLTQAFDNTKGATTTFASTLGGGVVNLDGDVPGANLNWGARGAAVSADGRYVSYVHTDFLGGCSTAGPFCVFEVRRRDLRDGSVVAVSHTTGGAESNGLESRTSISDDGRYVAFLSDATDLDPAAATPEIRLYRTDVVHGTTTLVAADVELYGLPFVYTMSGDGTRFAYTARSDVDPWPVVRIVDLIAGTNLPLVRQDTTGGHACTDRPTISGDGSAVLFHLCSAGAIVEPAGTAVFAGTAVARLTAGASGLDYSGVTPSRLYDSRDGQTDTRPNLTTGQTVAVTVGGRGGVPADATAAVLNVTVTNAAGAGFVTVWPCDQERPTASNLNYTAGQTIPNAVVAGLAPDGTVCLYTSNAADLVVDVAGSFGAASSYGSAAPLRVLDTRADEDPASPPALAPGSVTTLDVVGLAGLPDTTAAVTLNVTVTRPAGAGFVTVFPCDADLPTASNLNYVAGQTIPNAVISLLAADGTVCLYTSNAADLIVDANGFFPAGSGFVGLPAARELDSRDGETDVVPNLGGGSTTVLALSGAGGVPSGAGTVVLNVTVTNPTASGFVTVFPCDADLPTASNLNYVAGQTIPNLVVSRLSPGGTVCLFTNAPADLIVDIAGYIGDTAAV